MDRSPGFGSIIYDLIRPIQTRFRFGSIPYIVLNLAIYNNSLDRSTKSTTSHLNVLCLLVNIGFQVLFHSPPGVLFTFPSRYCFTIGHQVVFSLTGWSPLFHTRFLVSRTTLDSTFLCSFFVYWTLTTYGMLFQTFLLNLQIVISSPNPICISTYGLGSSYFARHYFRNHYLFSLPMGTKMFQFPTFPSYILLYSYADT